MTRSDYGGWRPSLGQVVTVVLITVICLPLVGLFFFRLYENQLVRETEAELIAQSAAIAAVFAEKVERLPPEEQGLGAVAAVVPKLDKGMYRPIKASLDLALGPILGSRPDARVTPEPVSAAYRQIGDELQDILQRTQITTLAGFRLLDANGTVIAGREENGMSLAHVEEIAIALKGAFQPVLRVRVVNRPAPPLYSISRGTGVRIFTAMPVIVEGRVAGVVYASRTPDNIIKHIYAERKKYILAALAVIAVALVVGLIFVRLIARPLHELVRRAGEIGRNGREPAPIRHYGTREISLLAQSLDGMAERLRERSDYIATFAAHVSHELKTPMTSIQGAAELLRDAPEMSEAERNRFLDNIIADTSRLTVILHRLRELARADNPQRLGSTNLRALADELKVAFPKLAVTALGDEAQIIPISQENAMIVLSHLADNAERHNARSLSLKLRTDGEWLRLRIEDDGDGISERNRAQIFEAFFTTRRESGGTGMGLRIAQAMLQAHHGSIELCPSEKGTAFELVLPLPGI